MKEQQEPTTAPLTVFYSYAHEDERLRMRLEKHLTLLRQQSIIAEWHDRRITPGTDWEHAINEHLTTASIILLLISPDFLASDYCWGVEMRQALALHETGDARVIPILLRPVDWESSPFAHLQCLPHEAKPVTQWRNLDEAFVDIARGIRRMIEEFYPDTGVLQHSSVVVTSHVAASSRQRATSSSEAKTVIRANPFTYGNPISSPTRFFGRQHEITQVFSRLRNAEFESSSLVGERRVGKTSLLNYLAHPDVRRSQGFDPIKYIFVYMDLQMIDTNMIPLRLWQRLLQKMADGCQDSEIKRILEERCSAGVIDTFTLADIFDSIDRKDQYIVFLLDEFEHIIKNQNFDSDFFYGLRSLAIHHHLAVITSSHRHLIDLCYSDAIRSSPFFNIFANINLRLFTKDEALHFIALSLVGTQMNFIETELEDILRIAGHHPYFLQMACSLLFDIASANVETGERKRHLYKAFYEKAIPQLEYYWDNANDQEKTILTILALLERQGREDEHISFSQNQLHAFYTRSNQLLTNLEGRGLLTYKDDTYSLFSTIFGKWIRQEITNTMHDHQSYDDWLISNKSIMQRIPSAAKKDIVEILPKISSKYRELIIAWMSDSRNLITVAQLLKGPLGMH